MFFKNFKNFNPIRIHSRNYMFIPRAAFSLLRLPIAAAGTGLGVSAYLNYKLENAKKEFVPDWLNESLNNANDYLQSLDLNSLNLPKTPDYDNSPIIINDVEVLKNIH
ncbi:hypothetical protein BC833DRAFT_599963 [Globomyces pollinis-pini]|nr:hypothetical protein BC833DRAFT_599963 [Globomyces pollinis-pini]